MTQVILDAEIGKVGEDQLAPLFEQFTHLRRKIHVRLETERTGNIVEEGALGRYRIDDVLAEQRAIETFSQPGGIIERILGRYRTVERDKNDFNHTFFAID